MSAVLWNYAKGLLLPIKTVYVVKNPREKKDLLPPVSLEPTSPIAQKSVLLSPLLLPNPPRWVLQSSYPTYLTLLITWLMSTGCSQVRWWLSWSAAGTWQSQKWLQTCGKFFWSGWCKWAASFRWKMKQYRSVFSWSTSCSYTKALRFPRGTSSCWGWHPCSLHRSTMRFIHSRQTNMSTSVMDSIPWPSYSKWKVWSSQRPASTCSFLRSCSSLALPSSTSAWTSMPQSTNWWNCPFLTSFSAPNSKSNI